MAFQREDTCWKSNDTILSGQADWLAHMLCDGYRTKCRPLRTGCWCESQRDFITQPRVGAQHLPWVIVPQKIIPNPNGVASPVPAAVATRCASQGTVRCSFGARLYEPQQRRNFPIRPDSIRPPPGWRSCCEPQTRAPVACEFLPTSLQSQS